MFRLLEQISLISAPAFYVLPDTCGGNISERKWKFKNLAGNTRDECKKENKTKVRYSTTNVTVQARNDQKVRKS